MRHIDNLNYSIISELNSCGDMGLNIFVENAYIIYKTILEYNKYDSYSNKYYYDKLSENIDYILLFNYNGKDSNIENNVFNIQVMVGIIKTELLSKCDIDYFPMKNKDYYTQYIDKMKELRKIKNADYGDSFNRSISKFGYTSAFSRVSDKLCRAMNLIETGKAQVEDESIEDSLLDAANYLIMTADDIKNRKDKNEKLIWSKNPSDMEN